MIVAHTNRAHSPIGSSGASRWTVCPISVLRSKGQPNSTTVFAQEGTAAHELVEHVMVHGIDPRSLVGGVVDLTAEAPFSIRAPRTFNIIPDNWNMFEIDYEMAAGAELYRDTILKYVEPGDIVEFETFLDMRHIHPDMFGTGDAKVFKPKKRHLIIFDYKYGRGVAVEAKDNKQGMSYALGHLKLIGVENIDKITIVIVQPRSPHVDGPVRVDEVDIIDLMLFEAYLRERALKTEDPNQPAVAGHHCRFCPVAWGCEEFRDYIFEILSINRRRARQNGLKASDMPDMNKLTPDQLARLLNDVSIVHAWVRRVEGHAHAQALEGNMPTGMKFVDKLAHRSFVSAEAVEALLEMLGFDEEEFRTPSVLKSPAQVEAAIGKKVFAKLLADQTRRVSTGVTLAPLSDKRPSVNPDKTQAFGSVDDDE